MHNDTHHPAVLKSVTLNYVGDSKSASRGDRIMNIAVPVDDLPVTPDEIIEFLGLSKQGEP